MKDKLIHWKQFLHQHPEIGMQEKITSNFILSELQKMPLDGIHQNLAGTGIVAVIKGKQPRTKSHLDYHSIGLRADMDALPLQEKNNSNNIHSISKHPGLMHACGHDAHCAILLGAALELSQTKDFYGTVYLIFQPGEEGFGGAKRMIEDGLFTLCPMDAIFALHVWPDLPLGHFALSSGAIMANSDEIEITITGKGGLGAQPHKTPDPIVALSELTLALQTIISRRINPHTPAVISITSVNSGTTHNIIPDKAFLRGTVRSLSSDVRDFLKKSIISVAEGVAIAHEVTIDVNYNYGYPATYNSEKETNLCKDLLIGLLGKERVHYPTLPSLGGEDFSFFTEKVPGCYVHLGVSGKFPLHHGEFYCSDDVLPHGVTYWSALVRNILGPK